MSIKKKAQYLGEGVSWLKGHGQMIPDYFGNLMRRIGGGERAVVRARQASPELIESRNSYKETQQAEKKLLRNSKNWKQPNSKRNVKRVNDAKQKTDEAKEAFNNTKKQTTNDALRQVRFSLNNVRRSNCESSLTCRRSWYWSLSSYSKKF